MYRPASIISHDDTSGARDGNAVSAVFRFRRALALRDGFNVNFPAL